MKRRVSCRRSSWPGPCWSRRRTRATDPTRAPRPTTACHRPRTRCGVPPTEQSDDPASGAETTERTACIEGRIAAVEPETGRFVLDTDEGPISLVTSPIGLAGVQVGDVVRVALTREPRAQ